ncbi:SDR family oxidoreductase [Streptomyces mirabilis]|nr:SDR family oxidoreductase [Streptomyces mirabilis]
MKALESEGEHAPGDGGDRGVEVRVAGVTDGQGADDQHAPLVAHQVEDLANEGLGEPEDLASVIVFLLSAESSWITGQILSVDGGLTMRE